MQKHENETRDNRKSGEPAKNLRASLLDAVRGLAVGTNLSKRKSGSKSAGVGPVINSDAPKNAEREQKD